MEHGCRNFHYRSNLAKSCKLRELTLKFHRENYERKEGGKNRISQVLKVGRRGKGKRRKRRRKKEKERGKGKKRKGGSEACGRERDSTEAWNEVESIGWGPSFSSSLHRLGIGGGRRRPITDDSHCLRYILSNGVPKLGAPLRSTRQSLSSEKKGEKKQLESFPFSLSLSVLYRVFSSSYHHSTTINLFSAPFSHFRTSLEIEPGFDQEGSQWTIRYSRIVERRSEEGDGRSGEESWGKFRADESNRPSPRRARSPDLWRGKRGSSLIERSNELSLKLSGLWFRRFQVSFVHDGSHHLAKYQIHEWNKVGDLFRSVFPIRSSIRAGILEKRCSRKR